MTSEVQKAVIIKTERRLVFKLSSICPILTLRSAFYRGNKEHILSLNFNTGDHDDGLTVQHHFYLGGNLDTLRTALRAFSVGHMGEYNLGLNASDKFRITGTPGDINAHFVFNPFGNSEMWMTRVAALRKTDNIAVAVDQLLELFDRIEKNLSIDEQQSDVLGRIKASTGFFPNSNVRTSYDYDDVIWPGTDF